VKSRSGEQMVSYESVRSGTDNLLKHARAKLAAKGLGAIVANDVSREDSGFDSENNALVILLRDDPQPSSCRSCSKLENCASNSDEIVRLRRASPTRRAAASESAETNESDPTAIELLDLLRQSREYTQYFAELGVETIALSKRPRAPKVAERAVKPCCTFAGSAFDAAGMTSENRKFLHH